MATVTTKTVDINNTATDYDTLALWEAQNIDCVSTDTIQIAKCQCASPYAADTSAVTIAGWTTDSTRYIKIWTDPSDTGSGGGGANGSHRHDGKWNTNAYRIETTYNPLEVAGEVYIIGLQTKITRSDWSYGNGIKVASADGQTAHIEQCIVKGVLTSSSYCYGIYHSSGGSNSKAYVSNCIVYDFVDGTNTNGGFDYDGWWNSYGYFYNNTAVNCRLGFTESQGYAYFKNCLSQDCYDGFTAAVYSVTTCLSDTAQAGGTDERAGIADGDITFVDAANDDYHLASGDTAAIDAGTDLSGDASYPITKDIDNVTRPTGAGTWDIGADEYVAPASTRRRAHVQTIG